MEEPPNPVVNLEEHPLQNQVILKIIFDFLESSATFQDWKNIRQVCKLWYSETLSRWRSSLAVLDFAEEAQFFRTHPYSKKLPASEFLILCQNPSISPIYKLLEKPYLNYKLQFQSVNLAFCESTLTASLFWSTVGPWMKSLILKHFGFSGHSDDDEISELLQFLIKKTPNLAHVTFEDGLFLSEWRTSKLLVPREGREEYHLSVVSLTCKGTFAYHFSCFPNLQKVRLECVLPLLEFPKLVFPNHPAIPEQNPVQNSKVTHLDMMNCAVHRETRPTFQRIKFPCLEHLSVNMSYSWDNGKEEEFGRNMIENHRETLKVLETFCWLPPQFGGDWAIRYTMPVLSKLFIWGNCMDNLDFLRFLPNLTLLHIDLYGFEKKDEMMKLVPDGSLEILTQHAYIPVGDKVEASKASGNLAGVVLQKLEYLQFNYKVSSESLRALGEWMPNLKIFKSVLDSSTLPFVCEVWPKLEKLHCLFGSEVVDEDVIGSVSKKGVADFKYLTSFHYNSECHESSLSDESARKGFLKMKELTDLQICVSQELSDKSEDVLTRRIQNVRIHRNYFPNRKHEYWKCCRDKSYLEFISNYTHPELRTYNFDSEYY